MSRILALAWAILFLVDAMCAAQIALEPNLVALDKSTPGAGRTCAWTHDGKMIDVPDLAVPGGTDPVALPAGTAAVGAVWPTAHVADQVKLTFTKSPPQAEDLKLHVFDGRQWITYRDGLAVHREANAVIFSFEPVATDMLRVALPADSSLARIEIRRYLSDAKQVRWPQRVVTGDLAREVLAREEEPSFESLRLYGLSMPAWAMTGLKDLGDEQGVYWDGQIHCHGRRILLSLGEPEVRLADVRDTVRRSLMDGWMPAVIVQAQVGRVAVTQTSFAAYADDAQTDEPAMFVRVELVNLGQQTFEGPLRVEVRDAPKDPFEGTLGVAIFNPPQDKSPSHWKFSENVLLRNGRPFLVSGRKCRAANEPSTLIFDVKLSPGEKTVVLFAVPSPGWQATVAEVARLAELPHEKALANFKSYWHQLLAPAMKVDLPETRLNHLYRAVLAQLFINAYGDVMPYGAAPSNYDGSVYGVEESYAMLALAMSGFPADAQRYLDGTYLSKRRPPVESLEAAEDRNQQTHNGSHPLYAIELYRLGRDRKWLAAHRGLLVECAEWTIANRRKTMRLEDGKKPLYWGLLPKWAFGGDVHQRAYPLYPNFMCWRALNDTAWALEQLGDHDLAGKYRREAADYRRTILAVIDAIYRPDARPPFLPLHVEATSPDHDDYYQLFAGLVMDLLPFEFSDPRANYLGDFLEQDNRTFCLLPRFRRHAGEGGLDGIYGLGHILSRLHQNRIREFLLGFYAFQVFNMEHTCFTSRESNRVFSSDLHLRTPSRLSDWSDPLPCSSAVGLLLLRHMLVTEETRGAADYTGNLLLLYGAPRRWFGAGDRIVVENAVTHAGNVSLAVSTSRDLRRIRADITMPADTKCPAVKIRLRHPQGKPIKSVSIDGREVATFDTRDELVEVPRPVGTVRVEAQYD